MKLFKKVFCFFRDMHVVWKFTLAYFIIIALPIIFVGIYISDSTTKSIIHQSELLAKQSLLQRREVINQKIESIERTSISIAYNPQILKYLEDPFQNSYQGYENYIYSFAMLFENYTMQNKNIYDTKLYLNNDSFPDDWNGIYHIDAIKKDEWYNKFLSDSTFSKKWRRIHDSKRIIVTGEIEKERVFSLCHKLISFNNTGTIGISEVEISEKVLFENLSKDKIEVGDCLVLDDQGNIVYQNSSINIPGKLKEALLRKDMSGAFSIENQQFVVCSIPLDTIGCHLVSITPLKEYVKGSPDYKTIIASIIIIVLILFGGIIYFVNKRLTKRLKLLVNGLKSVRDENLDIKLQVDGHDEYGELAENFNRMTNRINELIEREYKAQIMEKESELKALEAQINPHFLYNTLSTISWMARKVHAENIDNLTMYLSKFYRLVLSKGNSVITVEDEINLLKAYVEIEKIRFENMLHVEYDLDEEAFHYKMIKIILQPIAENTINHGILPKNCRGTMIVRLRQDEENLYFTIIDDGIGMNRKILEDINSNHIIRKESGYAIHNIKERLKSVYGDKCTMSIVSRPGIGCAVNIVIPKYLVFPNF